MQLVQVDFDRQWRPETTKTGAKTTAATINNVPNDKDTCVGGADSIGSNEYGKEKEENAEEATKLQREDNHDKRS